MYPSDKGPAYSGPIRWRLFYSRPITLYTCCNKYRQEGQHAVASTALAKRHAVKTAVYTHCKRRRIKTPKIIHNKVILTAITSPECQCYCGYHNFLMIFSVFDQTRKPFNECDYTGARLSKLPKINWWKNDDKPITILLLWGSHLEAQP